MAFLTKKSISRRRMLQGLGAGVALPLLDSMIPSSTALAQTAATPPKRFGAVFVPHGERPGFWTPDKVGADFEVSPILSPLAAYRDRLTVVSQLNGPVDGHAVSVASWLSGTIPKRTTAEDVLAGITIDQVIAKKIGQETVFPSLEVATEDFTGYIGGCDPAYACTYLNTLSWRSGTQPLPMEINPRVLFERMFGRPGTAQQRLARMKTGRSILDSVQEDLKDLQRDLGAHDRTRLSDYLDNVRETEARIQRGEKQAASNVEIPDAPVGIPDSFPEHIALQFELIALAYMTDLTRVFTFMLSRDVTQRTYPEIGITEPHHALSHHSGDEAKKKQLVELNRYHVTMFEKFLRRLRDTPEGDGSILDNSMILYGSGMSESQVHLRTDLPTLLVGGFKNRGSRHIKAGPDTPIANFMLSLGQYYGVEMEKFGISTGDGAAGVRLVLTILLLAGSAVAQPLLDAVQADQADKVAALLAAGGDPDAANRYGITPLWLAATNGSITVTQMLLKAGADAKAKLPHGETALMAAARTGRPEPIQILLAAGADPNASETSQGETALMWAAAENHPEAIRILIKGGADPNQHAKALDLAPMKWMNVGMVDTILPRGGFTAILYAARQDARDAVRALAEGGASLETQDADGTTALHYAIMNQHYDMAALLLEKGANPNTADNTGMTALYAAVEMNAFRSDIGRPARLLPDERTALDVIKLALQHGADPNARLRKPTIGRHHGFSDGSVGEGGTALMRAIKNNDFEAMRILLDAGANPSLGMANGSTPLLLLAAARVGPGQEAAVLGAIRSLAEHGININAANTRGDTALHTAARAGLNSIVRTLAELGADLNAKDAQGKTALDAVSEPGRNRHEDTAALLKELAASR